MSSDTSPRFSQPPIPTIWSFYTRHLVQVVLTVCTTIIALWLYHAFRYDSPEMYVSAIPRFPPASPQQQAALDWEQSAAWVKVQLTALAEGDEEAGWHAIPSPATANADTDTTKSKGNRRLRSVNFRRPRKSLPEGIHPSTKHKGASSGRRSMRFQNLNLTATEGGDPATAGGESSGGVGNVRGGATGASIAADKAGEVDLPTALLAVTTANVWDKTEKLLQSLAVCRDRFELLVIDELSTDATRESLKALGATVIEAPSIQGVTANWNMMYERWQRSAHDYLFIINNDVLIPDGVITRLMHSMRTAGSDCDLTAPISTRAGKGHWGTREGLEVLYGLDSDSAAAAFVSIPNNYARVQVVLSAVPAAEGALVRDTMKGHNDGFSGFFFGVRRSIDRAAFNASAGQLFDPTHINIHQEGDLWGRIQKKGNMKVCMDAGSFAFHYKGSTVGAVMGEARENFRAPGR